MEYKEIKDEWFDSVFFSIDAYKVDLEKDIYEQINEIMGSDDKNHIILTTDSYEAAKNIAKQLIKFDENYNFSLISINQYSYNEETEEIECKLCDIVAEYSADYPEEQASGIFVS